MIPPKANGEVCPCATELVTCSRGTSCSIGTHKISPPEGLSSCFPLIIHPVAVVLSFLLYRVVRRRFHQQSSTADRIENHFVRSSLRPSRACTSTSPYSSSADLALQQQYVSSVGASPAAPARSRVLSQLKLPR